MMEDASPGHFEKEAVDCYKQLLEKATYKIIPAARSAAFIAGRKRVSAQDIRVASDQYFGFGKDQK